MVSKQSVVPVATVDSKEREEKINDSTLTSQDVLYILLSILLCYNIVLTVLVAQAGNDFLCPEGKYVQGYKNGILICKDFAIATPTDHNVTNGSVINSELAAIGDLSCNGNEIIKRKADGTGWGCSVATDQYESPWTYSSKSLEGFFVQAIKELKLENNELKAEVKDLRESHRRLAEDSGTSKRIGTLMRQNKELYRRIESLESRAARNGS